MVMILNNSKEILQKVKSLFSSKNSELRRVIIVGYVGIDAIDIIPYFNGVEIYCWPKAGGTNPNAIRDILNVKGKVFFVDKLHMKLYWVENRGAIITSANLSKNALGEGGLYEFGIFIEDPSLIEIDDIISKFKAEPVEKNDTRLKLLQKQHDIFWAKHQGLSLNRNKSNQIIFDFNMWYRRYTEKNSINWKFGWYEVICKLSEKSKSRVKIDFLSKKATDWINCEKDSYKITDWILMFYYNNKTCKVKDFKWTRVDFIEDDSGEKDYPFQAVQVNKISNQHTPPFNINKMFEKAFNMTIAKMPADYFYNIKSLQPSKQFIEGLNKNYNSGR